jgi:hypothetical protein
LLRFQKREEELVQRVNVAIQQLQLNGQQVSGSAIAALVHVSYPGLYRYPRVRLILRSINPQKNQGIGEYVVAV